MPATFLDQAHKAWQQALGQLRYTLNRAEFETWVRDARPLSYDGQVFQVGVANAYARDWLAERLRTPLENQLRGILNAPVQVVFVVASPAPTESLVGAPPPPYGTIVPQEDASPTAPPSSSQPIAHAPPAPQPVQPAVDLQEVSLRLRDALQQPHRVIFLPAYFLRWLPYLGTRASWLYVALRQAHFLSQQNPDTPHQPIRPGQAVEATRQTLANWSHLTKRTINNILNQGLLTPLVQVERDRHLDAHRQAPNRYIFTADMPLTPADVQAALTFLHRHGLTHDPIAALSAALQQPHERLLAPPPPTPPARWQKNTPPSLRAEVAAVLQAHPIPATTLAKALGMAELLETSLIEGEGKLFIPWYFIHNHLPRLGHTLAWLYLTARHHAYQRGHPTGNGFRQIQTTTRQVAAWLGLKKARYGREMIPVAAEATALSTDDTAVFLHRLPGRGNTFTLAVQMLLPLTPVDEQAYRIALEVIAIGVQKGNTAHLARLQTLYHEKGLNAATAYLQHTLHEGGKNEFAPEAWQRAAEALSRLASQLPEFSPGSPATETNKSQKFLSEASQPSSSQATSFPPPRHKIPSAKAKNFSHFNLKTPSSPTPKNKPPTSEVGGASTYWTWEDLLPHLQIAPKLQPLLKQHPAWLGVAWLLYVTAHYQKFENPLGFALHKIQAGQSPGGAFEALAQRPKETLHQAISRCLRHGPEAVVALFPEWKAFRRTPLEALEQLRDWLGMDFV